MNKVINPNEIQWIPLSSGVDNFGRLFYWNDRIFRAVIAEAVPECLELFSCGLIDELVLNDYIPDSKITDYSLEGYSLIIEHKKITKINYPYEWSFSMLKDVAFLVLKINMIAQKYGFQTKDCHQYNIMFDGCIPKYVDIGSFTKVPENYSGFLAYDEFIRHYLYVLSIWSEGNNYLARLLLTDPVGGMSHESYSLLNRYNLYYRLGNILRKIIRLKQKITVKINKLFGENTIGRKGYDFCYLIKKIDGFKLKSAETAWKNYHDDFYKTDGELKTTPRFNRIIELIKKFNDIKDVTDLGANQGIFSRLLLKNTSIDRAVCIDNDEYAVDKMYQVIKSSNDEKAKITPVLLNFVRSNTLFDSTDGFPFSQGRYKSDAVIALAITHHLILAHNMPIDRMFSLIGKYTKKYIFIEFMPLGLWGGGEELPPVPSWYTIDWFREHFNKHFHLFVEEKLGTNRILFVGQLLD